MQECQTNCNKSKTIKIIQIFKYDLKEMKLEMNSVERCREIPNIQKLNNALLNNSRKKSQKEN